ncbi:MAG: zf-HC2 domain-containing protein [Caldicoprobacterales bacterium]|nr:zf-HC2 domain-containing protein [Clostridiales bacterium]
MKLSCDVINDLLPLYVEDLASDDTRILVEEHLKTCSNCKKQLEFFQDPGEIPIDTIVEPFKKIERKLFRKQIQIVTVTVALVLVVVIIGMAYLTSPDYLPYSNNNMSLTEYEDGKIIITFNHKVAGYDIEKYSIGDGTGDIYHITTWNTIFNQYFLKNNIQSIILNPGGDKVASIYYYSTDGKDDILIYGKDQNPGGGIRTLPRLFLGYYLVIVGVLAILCGILLFIFRKKDNIRNAMERIFLLPISYFFSHLCIKGFITTSYLAYRDFFLILLLMIPIYCLLLLSIKLYRSYRKTKKVKL